jgi:hypothetical protein
MRNTLAVWLCAAALAIGALDARAAAPAGKNTAAADDMIVPVNLQQGIMLAQQSVTPMFVMLTRQQCGNCNNLKGRIASDQAVKDQLKNYVVVDVDVDGPVARQWQSRFPAPGQTLPFVYLVSANGQGIKSTSGVVQGEELPTMLKEGLTKAEEIHQAAGLLKKKKKRVAKAKDDAVAAKAGDAEAGAEEASEEKQPAKAAKAPPKPRVPAKVDPAKQAASALKMAQSFAAKRPEKAIKYAEQVIELAPGTPLAAEAQKLLQTLR